jgi:hypothetical protein
MTFVGQDFILRAISNRAILRLQANGPIGNRPQVENLPHIAKQITEGSAYP